MYILEVIILYKLFHQPSLKQLQFFFVGTKVNKTNSDLSMLTCVPVTSQKLAERF